MDGHKVEGHPPDKVGNYNKCPNTQYEQVACSDSLQIPISILSILQL